MRGVLASVNEAEAKVLWTALAQYVENAQCTEEAEDAHVADPLLTAAEGLLERLNAAMASL